MAFRQLGGSKKASPGEMLLVVRKYLPLPPALLQVTSTPPAISQKGSPIQTSGKSSNCSTTQVLESRSSILVLTHGSTDDFEARSPDELSLSKGDRIELIERDDDFGDGWYLGKHLQNGKTGLFPEGERSYLRLRLALTDFSSSVYYNHSSSDQYLCEYHGHGY